MRPTRLVLSFFAVALICAAASPAASLPHKGSSPRSPVVATGADERNPAADGAYVAWTANTFLRPRRYNVYFSQGGGPKQRVNPPGTRASTGGIDGTELIYSEFTPNEPGGSDLVLYDMATDTTLPTPTGVNTAREELNPTNSGDYLLFERDRSARRHRVERIVLHNTMTDTETILVESERKLLLSGQVNGNWAVYVVCGRRPCNVFRYDITNDETAKVPNPGGKYQYASSVSDVGVVYFARSGRGICQNVRFMTWDGATEPTHFFDLPDGKDLYDSFFDDTASSLYYERIGCRDAKSDIFIEPAP